MTHKLFAGNRRKAILKFCTKPPACLSDLPANWYQCTELGKRYGKSRDYFYSVFWRMGLQVEKRARRFPSGHTKWQSYFFWPGFSEAMELHESHLRMRSELRKAEEKKIQQDKQTEHDLAVMRGEIEETEADLFKGYEHELKSPGEVS